MVKKNDIASVILVLTLISIGQAMAKKGAEISVGSPTGLNGFLIISYLVFLARGIIWSLILTRHPVSRVYPYLSLSYPLILIISLIFFNESLSAGKIAGTLLILSGTLLMFPKKTVKEIL